jgi:hypothetical protein
VYTYVVLDLNYPIILRNPWKVHNRVRTVPEKKKYRYGRVGK